MLAGLTAQEREMWLESRAASKSRLSAGLKRVAWRATLVSGSIVDHMSSLSSFAPRAAARRAYSFMLLSAVLLAHGNSAFAEGGGWPRCRGTDPDGRIAGCSEVIAGIDGESPRNKIAAYVNRAGAYQIKGDYARALEDLAKALEFDPKSALLLTGRGGVHHAQGDLDAAIADYTRAITFDRNYVAAYSARALAWRARGDAEKAIADLGEAMKIDKRAAAPCVHRGALFQAKGDWDHAIADFSEAIKREPRLALARNNRGLAYHGKGDFDRAIADFDEAIELDAKYATAYLNRGNAWRGKHDLERARRDLEEALTIKPDLAAAKKSLDDVTRLIAKRAPKDAPPAPAAPAPVKSN
jgi:tetratricopeptide (TPR) repeat protein